MQVKPWLTTAQPVALTQAPPSVGLSLPLSVSRVAPGKLPLTKGEAVFLSILQTSRLQRGGGLPTATSQDCVSQSIGLPQDTA